MAEHQRENMELSATHFEPICTLSAVLSRSFAYQEMKCIAECKMAASYDSALKRQLKQNFQTTPRTNARIIQVLLLRKEIIHSATSIIRTCLWSQQTFFPSKYAMKLRCTLNLFRFQTKIVKRLVLTRVLTNAFH